MTRNSRIGILIYLRLCVILSINKTTTDRYQQAGVKITIPLVRVLALHMQPWVALPHQQRLPFNCRGSELSSWMNPALPVVLSGILSLPCVSGAVLTVPAGLEPACPRGKKPCFVLHTWQITKAEALVQSLFVLVWCKAGTAAFHHSSLILVD